MLEYILVPLTMAASYMHGRGDGPDLVKQWYETKGVYVAALALLGALLGFLSIGYWGLLGSLISPLYWFGFRSSRQAVAELDYMSRVGSSLKNIAAQYALPVVACVIPMLFAKMWITAALTVLSVAAVVVTAKLFRNDDGESARDNRFPVELANGLVGGLATAGLLIAISVLV